MTEGPQPEYDSVPGWLAQQWKHDLQVAAEMNSRALVIEENE